MKKKFSRRRLLRHSCSKKRTSIRKWTNSLADVPCFLIGCGPSLDDHPISNLKDHFTIGINSAYEKIDPTILLWQDIEFWIRAKHDLPKLYALKYSAGRSDPSNTYYHFDLTTGFYKIPKSPTVLHGRGNSGALAFELAYILGCNPIVLLGFDCQYRDDKTDFFGNNVYHKPHTLKMCANALRWIKSQSKERRIINCSDNKIFKTNLPLKDAISIADKSHGFNGRDYFISRLFNET